MQVEKEGTGVGEDTAVGVGETIPGIYCRFGDNLVNVPGNLKIPSRWQWHEWRALPKQQQHICQSYGSSFQTASQPWHRSSSQSCVKEQVCSSPSYSGCHASGQRLSSERYSMDGPIFFFNFRVFIKKSSPNVKK